MSVGRPVQIFALVALLLAVVGGGVVLLQTKPSASPAPAVAAQPAAHPVTHHRATPLTPATAAKPAVATPAVANPAVVPPATPRLVAANGLPMPLAKALRKHRVVVVSLFDPESRTDAISFAEARAGAKAAGAGFLGVSVLNDSVAGTLTAALPGGGLLPVPGLLIYRRPGTLVERIDGFADRDAVAQLALAALTASPISAPAVTAPAATTPAPAVTAPVETTTTP